MSAHSHKRTLALPDEVEHWSLTTLREKLVKIGAKVVSHGRYVTFQLAEVAIPRRLFAEILRLIDGLRPRPAPATLPYERPALVRNDFVKDRVAGNAPLSCVTVAALRPPRCARGAGAR